MPNSDASSDNQTKLPIDGIIQLFNGDAVDPEEFDNAMRANCHYIQHIVVAGNDKFYPLALIFPDSKLFTQPDYFITPLDGCFCPRNTDELADA